MSTESNDPNLQEQELWNRITTTEGADRAEVLDELSHLAFKKNNYIECLQFLETSIEIYKGINTDLYSSKLEHLYEGKALCHGNLNQHAEAAEAYQALADLYLADEKHSDFLSAQRAAGRSWYEAHEWQKSFDAHTAVIQALDPDATEGSQATDLLNVGMALLKLERAPESIEKFLAARTLFKTIKDPDMVNCCDSLLADAYIKTANGMEAVHHAQLTFNFSIVAENLDLEKWARYRLGAAHRINKNYPAAESEYRRSLELLTLDEKDWDTIIKANNELAAVLFAQGNDEEAKEILDRIADIEDTLS